MEWKKQDALGDVFGNYLAINAVITTEDINDITGDVSEDIVESSE